MGKIKENTVFVGSLISTITEDELRNAFEDLKGIGHIKIVRDYADHFCKGYGFVTINGGKKNLEAV